MKLSYDDRLQEILNNYEIEILDTSALNNNFEGIIIKALQRKCKNRTCALWGAGQNNTKSSHAAVMITKYATFIQNMACVIDSNPEFKGKQFLGYPIIAPEQISDYGIDLVIIASKNSGDSIKKNLFELDNQCDYFDVYEELRNQGIQIFNNFYDENSIYSLIYNYMTQFREKDNEEALMKLISLYYSIRDFYYAFYYTDVYVKKRFNGWVKYKEAKKEMVKLLKKISYLNSKKLEDVSLFYIDALRASDVFDEISGKPKIFKRYISESKLFTEMYSTAVTTYESMMSVIAGRLPLETNVYENDFLHKAQEFYLLNHYMEQGYNINFLVSDCYKIIDETPDVRFIYQNYMPLKLWTLACSMAETKETCFNFLYFPYEIHFPLLCGFHKNEPVIRAFSDIGINEFPASIQEQYMECVAYTDKQFEFYYDLIGSHTCKVIFSDHSQIVYDPDNNGKTFNMYYKQKELTTHVPLIISSALIKPKVESGLYSMLDFNSIVYRVLMGGEVTDLSRDIVRYQYYPLHNPKIREHACEFGFDDYIDGMEVFLSKKFLGIITATGNKEVYRLGDLSTNIVNEDDGRSYLDYVRTLYHPAYN